MADLADQQKQAWLDARAVPLDFEWQDDFDNWSDIGEFCDWCGRSAFACDGHCAISDDPLCDCGRPAWDCRCNEREQATLDKLRRDTWRRVGALRHIELGPAPCPACDGDGVYEARVRGRLDPIGLCPRCRGVEGDRG